MNFSSALYSQYLFISVYPSIWKCFLLSPESTLFVCSHYLRQLPLLINPKSLLSFFSYTKQTLEYNFLFSVIKPLFPTSPFPHQSETFSSCHSSPARSRHVNYDFLHYPVIISSIFPFSSIRNSLLLSSFSNTKHHTWNMIFAAALSSHYLLHFPLHINTELSPPSSTWSRHFEYVLFWSVI